MPPRRPDDDLAHLPLRERKKERTRRRLRDLALQMFSEEGFDAVSVERIADAAEVAPRTFFRYFPTKEAVLLGDLRARAATLPEALRRAGEEHPDDTLAAVVAGVVAASEDYEADRERMLQQAAIVAGAPGVVGSVMQVAAQWQATLSAFVAEREGCDPRADLYPSVVASAVAGAQQVAVQRWVASGGGEDAASLIAAALDQVVPGLTTHRVPHVGRR